MNFYGKVILVTGASSAIGAAAAIKFAKHGATLVLVSRNIENLKEIAEKCLAKDSPEPNRIPAPLLVQADLTNESDVEQIIRTTLQNCCRLDVLVNAAETFEIGSIETITLEQYDRIMNVNLRSVYHLTMLALPELVKTKGNIINVSSICGLLRFPNILSYAISKACIDTFTRCVALDVQAKGVRCNAVNPGVIVNQLHKRKGMDEAAYTKFLQYCEEKRALEVPEEINEVTKAILFYAGSTSGVISGATAPVGGGKEAYKAPL